MTTHNFSIEYLAMSLVVRLDIRNIFPPLINNPESFISPSNNSSSVQKKPPNAFLLCRKNVQEEAKRKGNYNMRVISKVTSILWQNASYEEKNVYKRIVDRIREIRCKNTSTPQKKVALRKKRSSRKSYSTIIQFATPTPQAAPSEELLVTPLPPPPLPLPIPILFPLLFDSAFNFVDNFNNQDFNSNVDFNGQITIPHNYNYLQNNYISLLDNLQI